MTIIDQSASTIENTPESVSYLIERDLDLCMRCNLCADFCPTDVFADREKDENGEWQPPAVVAPELCWGCETCVGQCPEQALTIINTSDIDPFDDRETAEPISDERHAELQEWSDVLREVLGLRWYPVAMSFIPAGAPLPDVPLPQERLRYCQSIMLAREGHSIMMPANRHSCPDGTSILGLTEVPDKLASGELYILFHKLNDIEAAKQMVAERPRLEPRTVDATVVAPLEKAVVEPDVILVVAQPEQVMWLCMAASYYTGHRFDFKASGYNAQCVEATLIPYTSQNMNISFGCYGCRAASDVGTDMMTLGIPPAMMPVVIKGLRELGKKAIPQSRAKIYLHDELWADPPKREADADPATDLEVPR